MQTEVTFTPDRAAYIRSQTWLAALAMAGAMAILWLIGNPYVWTGAPAALLAIVGRGWYLMDEELSAVWTLRDGVLHGPGERRVRLDDITELRTIAGAVQIVTAGGDKHLIKYQANPQATISIIKAAR